MLSALQNIRFVHPGLQDCNVRHLAEKCLTSEYQKLVSHSHSELSYQPSGLPLNRKRFNMSNFCLQLNRLLYITFRADCRIFAASIFFITAFYCIMATMFNSQMARPSTCVSRADLVTSANSSEQTTECALSDIYENSLVMENICFLSYSFMFVGYLMICSSAQFFLPLAKVFRNEHRNRKCYNYN